MDMYIVPNCTTADGVASPIHLFLCTNFFVDYEGETENSEIHTVWYSRKLGKRRGGWEGVERVWGREV